VGAASLGAAPAGASLTGACAASGRLESDGVTYRAKSLPDVVTIQASDAVSWQGRVPGGGAEGKGPKRAINGEVVVDFPFGSVTVGDWNNPASETYANSGRKSWDLPSWLAGVEIPVHGSHHERSIDCVGNGVVKIDGTSPALFVSIGLGLLSLVGIVFALRARPA
jgi:hypothetical protein